MIKIPNTELYFENVNPSNKKYYDKYYQRVNFILDLKIIPQQTFYVDLTEKALNETVEFLSSYLKRAGCKIQFSVADYEIYAILYFNHTEDELVHSLLEGIYKNNELNGVKFNHLEYIEYIYAKKKHHIDMIEKGNVEVVSKPFLGKYNYKFIFKKNDKKTIKNIMTKLNVDPENYQYCDGEFGIYYGTVIYYTNETKQLSLLSLLFGYPKIVSSHVVNYE